MLFKRSLIPLSAAVILVMDSDNYAAACLFFGLGVIRRMIERKEEEED